MGCGEVVVLAGPNGSGKTTTIECIAGLRRPTAGRVLLGGRELDGTIEDRAWFGLQLQESALPPNSRVSECLRVVAALYREPIPAAELRHRLGLAHVANSYYENLAGGEKRRLNVALAFVGRPPLVMLDEPTSGVDPQGRVDLWRFVGDVARSGTSILLTTHDLSEAEDYADRLIALRHGKIALSGSVKGLLEQHQASWRLRTSALPDLLPAFDDIGLRVFETDGVMTAFGDRAQVLLARTQLESGADGRQDVVVGPTRLEDLFLLETMGER